jgi:diaminopimelate decarboxylase
MHMTLDHRTLRELSHQAGGTFYLFDENRFVKNYSRLRERLRHYHDNTQVAYALKANYMPRICEIIDDLGGMAEVVSRFEFDVARRHLPADKLIFNGPIKREDDLRMALRGGSAINIDSFKEIGLLETLAGEFDEIHIGLRINFASLPASRFGFQAESGELDHALSRLALIPNLKVTGLHCHVSDRARGVTAHIERIRLLGELAARLAPRYTIETLNVGGGLLGGMPEPLKSQFPFEVPSLNAYADAIGSAFKRHAPSPAMQLIVEPGISMVADTHCLVAEVMEVRERNGTHQALIDTSINSTNPTRSRNQPMLHAVTARVNHAGSQHTYCLVGHTCMEHDVICEAFTGSLSEGDYIVFENRGAYSVNYTPPFITPAPAVLNRQGLMLKRADDYSSVLVSYCSRHAGSFPVAGPSVDSYTPGLANHADVK